MADRQMQADEVEVFELFGGDLPVKHHIVTIRAKGMGDRSHKPFGLMPQIMSVAGKDAEKRSRRDVRTFMKIDESECNLSIFSDN
ncbi:hypothetical protein D3C80_1463640 [compost metagenome]